MGADALVRPASATTRAETCGGVPKNRSVILSEAKDPHNLPQPPACKGVAAIASPRQTIFELSCFTSLSGFHDGMHSGAQ